MRATILASLLAAALALSFAAAQSQPDARHAAPAASAAASLATGRCPPRNRRMFKCVACAQTANGGGCQSAVEPYEKQSEKVALRLCNRAYPHKGCWVDSTGCTWLGNC
ncbi:MAG: hypothetical protein ACHP84_20215 [Caulobacterales bacterium]